MPGRYDDDGRCEVEISIKSKAQRDVILTVPGTEEGETLESKSLKLP